MTVLTIEQRVENLELALHAQMQKTEAAEARVAAIEALVDNKFQNMLDRALSSINSGAEAARKKIEQDIEAGIKRARILPVAMLKVLHDRKLLNKDVVIALLERELATQAEIDELNEMIRREPGGEGGAADG
jgi:flagellar hook-basal body complex protein FliE